MSARAHILGYEVTFFHISSIDENYSKCEIIYGVQPRENPSIV